jgi:5-methylcytosine-specific restriction endonuclease McrA
MGKAYYEAHKAEIAEKNRAKRLADPEKKRAQWQKYYQSHKEQENARLKDWYATHKEENNAASRAYHQAHKEELREKARTYYQENKEKYRESSLRYKRRMYALLKLVPTTDEERQLLEDNKERLDRFKRNEYMRLKRGLYRRRARMGCVKRGAFTDKEWQIILETHAYRCAYCQVEDREHLTMDHVIPLSKGGKHDASNIVPACLDCNRRKQSQDVSAFLALKGQKELL